MEINKEELQEIMNALEYGWFEDLHECSFYEQIVVPFKKKYTKSFTYDTGATKGVLIFEKLNFVIKIPFTCSGDEESFCGADDSGEGWNYCEVEEIKYQRAETIGIEGCFAKTILIGNIGWCPIYAQELARIYTKGGSPSPKKTEKEYEKIETICDEIGECFNRIWLSDVFDYFGEKTFYNLLNFIDDYNISDLHDGNLGYIGMRPVLVDYSSYND